MPRVDLLLLSDASGNAVFDASGSFIIFATLFGIKVVNLVTGKLQVARLGSSYCASACHRSCR